MKRALILIILLAIALITWVVFSPQPRGEVAANVISFSSLPSNFQRAEGERRFEFPRDHGPHNEYQTEWWYYTGNLADESGRRFGYQLTFFRRALLPRGEAAERSSNWAVEQVYLAHFTLTDAQNNDFMYWEKMARGAANLAGASVEPFYQVWLYHWRVEQISDRFYQLTAAQDGVRISLMLEDLKGPILQGISGYSQKGSQPGNASYYYSQTRLKTSGTLELGNETFVVTGSSWMDHEFSTSALSDGQIGWDWFSLQLDGQREIMVYTIRREDGSMDRQSSGTLVETDGSNRHIRSQDFQIEVTRTWRSQKTGTDYPAGWVLQIPSEDIRLVITPLISDQELVVSFLYWEGAVDVTGTWAGESITGRGYVELTGYAGSMQGLF